jgi:hypothetical protein
LSCYVGLIALQDPYVELWAGSGREHFKSRVHHGGNLNPKWNQAFILNLEGDEDLLHVHVMDKNSLDVLDRHIGTMTISSRICYMSLISMIIIIGRLEVEIPKLKIGETDWYFLVNPENFTESAGEIQLRVDFRGRGLVPYAPARHLAPIYEGDAIGIAIGADANDVSHHHMKQI